MTGIRDNADHWRLRSRQARKLAEALAGEGQKEMLRIATAYQKIADNIRCDINAA
jgi:hypothetical protein